MFDGEKKSANLLFSPKAFSCMTAQAEMVNGVSR